MFLHCQVKLCDHQETQCFKSCPARRRRSEISQSKTADLVVPLQIGKTRPPPRSRLSRILSFLRNRG